MSPSSSALRLRRIPVSPPKVKEWEVKGWRGAYDTRSANAERNEPAILINLDPVDVERAGELQLRAGLRRLTTPTTLQLASLDSWQGFAGLWFGSGQLFRLILVSAGEIWELDPVGLTLTKRVSTANLTAAGITLSSAKKVYITQFGLNVIFSEDVSANRPFMWDGTAAGGLTALTNAPQFITGPPTVYYGKLFFLKTLSHTIVWSEENQANTGYEAGGFNNAWSLTQTSASIVQRLLGTNEGLYYFRRDSTGVIRGAVSSTFQTDGVHDSVSIEAGTDEFWEPLGAGGAVWWLSQDNHPMVYRPDVGALDLATQLPRVFGGVQGPFASGDTTYLGSIGEQQIYPGTSGCILLDRANQRVHFEFLNGSTTRVVLIFDAMSLKYLGLHAYVPGVNYPDPNRRWAEIIYPFAAGSPKDEQKWYCDKDGFLFRQQLSTESSSADTTGFDETHNGAGVQVEGTLIGPMHGHSADIEWEFLQLDVLADAQPNNDVTVGYITSRFHKAALTPADQNVQDVVAFPNYPHEKHRAFGLKTTGRWLRPIITLGGEATQNRLPKLFGYSLKAVALSRTPSIT